MVGKNINTNTKLFGDGSSKLLNVGTGVYKTNGGLTINVKSNIPTAESISRYNNMFNAIIVGIVDAE